MSANKLVFETGIDGTGFERGLHSLGHSATHNLKSLVVGAFGLYGIHQILDRAVESAEELINTSKRLGEVPEQLQVMRQAAKEGGLEFSRLAMAYDKVNIAREKALSGDAKMKAAFSRFGIGESDLRSKTAGELLRGAFRDAARSQNPQDLAAPGAQIFGPRNFGSLLPTLTSDFEELQHKMEALGSILSTETAVAVKQLKDEFDLLSNIIVAQVAPVLVTLVSWLIQVVGKVKEWGAALGGYFGKRNTPGIIGDVADQSMFGGMIGQFMKMFGMEPKNAADASAEAGKAANTVEDEWKKVMEKMQHELDEAAERLKHPQIATIAEGLAGAPPKRAKRTKEFNPDGLLQVGNFLGSGKDIIASIAEQHLDVARETLKETKTQTETSGQMRDYLQAISEASGTDYDVPN